MGSRFCTECGNNAEAHHKVCTQCGHQLSPLVEETGYQETEKKYGETLSQYSQKAQEVSKSLVSKTQAHLPKLKSLFSSLIGRATASSKRTKIIISSAVALIILLIGGFSVGSVMTSKDKVIDRFQSALVEKDARKLAKVLSSTDPNLKITEENLGPFLTYLEQNPNVVSNIINSVNEQSRMLDQSTMNVYNENVNWSMIYLIKDGKKGIIYNNYVININPIYFDFYSNYNGTKIIINGKEVGEIEDQDSPFKYGPVLPGVYTVEAKYEGEFAELSTGSDISYFDSSMEAIPVELFLEGSNVYIHLPYNEMGFSSNLLINGNPQEIDVYQEEYFGPIKLDGSLKASVEVVMPWGSAVTEEKIVDSESLYLEFNPFSKELKETVFNTINTYAKESASALAHLDSTEFTLVSSGFKSYMEEQFESMRHNDKRWTGQVNGTTFDLDSLILEGYDETFAVYGNVKINSKQVEYYLNDDVEPSLEEKKNYYSYRLVYDKDNKKWLVDNFSPRYEYTFDNSEEFKEGEPTLQKPDESKIKKNYSEEQIGEFLTNYLKVSVEAINQNDFSLVEKFINQDGPKYKEQKDYTAYLNKKNITEDLLNVRITEIVTNDNNEYTVYTNEEYNIYYEDNTVSNKKFNSIYKVVIKNNQLFVNELISTNEITE